MVKRKASTGRYRSRIRHYWQAIAEDCAVRWTIYIADDGEEYVTDPSGLLIFGYLRAEDLRSIRLSDMQPHRSGFPEFHQRQPPTARDIRSAWRHSAGARARAEAKAAQPRVFRARGESESHDMFYRRVAQFYRESLLATGTPAKDIAAAADVPLSTSKWWIREARSRGFLPPSMKGQGIA